MSKPNSYTIVLAAALVWLVPACSSPKPAEKERTSPAGAVSKEPVGDVPAQVQEERARQRRDPWGAKKEDIRARKEEFLKTLTDPNKMGASGVKHYAEKDATLVLQWDERLWDDLPFSQKEDVVESIGRKWVELRRGSEESAGEAGLLVEAFKSGKRLARYTPASGVDVTTAK